MAFAVASTVSTGWAEIIHLKNGKKIRARIIESNEQQIKVDISGVKITYYRDEIERIEKESQSVAPQPPAVPKKLDQASGSSESPLPQTPQPPVAPQKLDQPSAPQTAAPTPPAPPKAEKTDKTALILNLIEESGTRDTMEKMFDQIVSQASPQEAPSLRQMLDINEITQRLVPIYDKYFTEKELQELINFYQSPTGRKLIEVMPLIMEDSMQATMSYFKEKMPSPQIPGLLNNLH